MDLMGEKFLFNDKILNKDQFIKEHIISSKNCYEVVRILDAKVLFWDEHYNRLSNSIFKFTNKYVELSGLYENVRKVINENNILIGNIKIEYIFTEDFNYNIYIYPIRFYYPNKGEKIVVNTVYMERENPSIKTYNYEFKKTVEEIINKNKLYEVLLVNKDGFITEGSRTNVYFVQDKKFHTAPENLVLSGVTRLKVNKLIKNLGYELIEKSVLKTEINNYEGCFLTSTSSNVLPIDMLDGINKKSIENRYIRELMDVFQKYLK